MLKNTFILLLSLLIAQPVFADKLFENFKFDDNTIQATNTNGGITLRPNGTGKASIYGNGDILTDSNTMTVGSKKFIDTTNIFVNENDTSAGVRFNASGITTGTTRILTVPDEDGEIILNNAAQTLNDKYFQTSSVNGELRFVDSSAVRLLETGGINYIDIKAPTSLSSNYTIQDDLLYRTISGNLNCDSGSAVTATMPAGSFTAVGNVSSGACSVTIGSGVFSSAPHCVASFNGALSTSVVNVSMTVSSSTAASIDCVGDAGGSGALAACSAYDVYVICFGPR